MEEEKKFQPASSSKVTPMRHPASRKGGNMEVCVVKPSSVDDSREITETLLSGRTVILNLEGMDLELAQRIIDFISGATFAINGNLQKISNYIFLVTPTNVDISGDLQDLLGGSMETPSVKGRILIQIWEAAILRKISIFWKSVLLNYPEMHIKEILSHTLIF